jgi:hypothetical protein
VLYEQFIDHVDVYFEEKNVTRRYAPMQSYVPETLSDEDDSDFASNNYHEYEYDDQLSGSPRSSNPPPAPRSAPAPQPQISKEGT